MRKLLLPFSLIYRSVMQIRNTFYDNGYFKITKPKVPVISVGNLTMGGTGKTPIICELIQWSLSKQLRPAVVSRGYKGTFKGVEKVPIASDARVYGDEPTMIASRFPTIPVYVGSDRVAVIEKLLEQEAIDIVFADDAFQHRRLGRTLDILVVDATEDITNYEVVPMGRGREDKMGLLRSDYIVLNKVNLVSPDKKKEIIDFVTELAGEKDIPMIEAEYYVSDLVNLETNEQKAISGNEKVLLISGIGNPKAFEGMLSKSFQILKHIIFSDHHSFSESDIKSIMAEADKHANPKIIMTEKDAVKMRRFSNNLQNTWVAVLNPKLSIRARGLYERILREIS